MAYLIKNDKGEHEIVLSLEGYPDDVQVLEEDVDPTSEHCDVVDDKIQVSAARAVTDALIEEATNLTPEDMLERIKLLELRVAMLETL